MNLPIKLTYFSSRKDNRTNKQLEFSGWEALVHYLEGLSDKEAYKPKLGEDPLPYHAPLISPAIYKEESLRRKDNVLCWAGWAALDVDEFSGTIKDLDKFNDGNASYIYSTPSSKETDIRFRLLVPLTRYVDETELLDFWYALNMKYLGLGDPQTKDSTRLFYVPGKYSDSFSFTRKYNGNYLNPDEIMAKYPLPKIIKHRLSDKLPRSMAKAVQAERESTLYESGINLNWTSWRNCPFVNNKAVENYIYDDSEGYYHRFYSLMVSIASRAQIMGYEISVDEIETIMREIDADTGNWYEKRPIRQEAERAIAFIRMQS